MHVYLNIVGTFGNWNFLIILEVTSAASVVLYLNHFSRPLKWYIVNKNRPQRCAFTCPTGQKSDRSNVRQGSCPTGQKSDRSKVRQWQNDRPRGHLSDRPTVRQVGSPTGHMSDRSNVRKWQCDLQTGQKSDRSDVRQWHNEPYTTQVGPICP
jgi:hypothetical protein